MNTQQAKKSHKKLLFVSGLGWMFDAMDIGLLSFLLLAIQKEWGLGPADLGWIASVNSIGMAIGALLFGIYADRKGRTNAFIITLLIFSIGCGLSALSTGVIMFTVLRFFIGMGLGGELPVASTLVAESVPASQRGKTAVLLESFWALGWMLAALMAWLLIPNYGWRITLVICTLPAFYAIYLRWNLPEPIRFQQNKKSLSFLSSWRLLWNKSNWKSTTMLWILWFCVVFSYYGMFLWLPSVVHAKGFDLVKSFGYVFIMTLAQLPGYFSVAWLIERIGRRWVLTIYLLGTAVAAWFFGNATSVTEVLLSGMALSFFNLGAWGAMYAYTPELYPTVIRASGAGMAASIGRIGGIFGPLMVGYLLKMHTTIPSIFNIFCASIVVAVLAILFLGRETKQQELVDN